ncbi:GDSL-type esterase/lipase family protein [Streptomyces sp. NPDC007808]|uniref:GDSL-type esterase/lipase family protein n=1 Tax=Streptomyces sp. NPDC007808 TaxID=3364779 RepID=UPI003692EA62
MARPLLGAGEGRIRCRPGTAKPGGVHRALTGPLAWLMAAVAAATLLVVAEPTATPAQAVPRPLSSTPFITLNMQGSNQGLRWQDTVRPFMQQVQMVMLQEVGADPPAGSNRPDVLGPDTQIIGGEEVRHIPWAPESSTRDPLPYHVYFLQTDDNGGRGTGGRVNIATVTRDEPDDLAIVVNPRARGRTALGLRYGLTWYFNFHALSGGGTDSARMIAEIARTVEGWGRQDGNSYTWVVAGDFNREPAELATDQGAPNLEGYFYRTHQPTHQSGRELDYAVSNDQVIGHQVYRLHGVGGDHYPVQVGGIRARGEVDPPPLRDDIVLGPQGDSITVGENSTDKNGYRLPLWNDLTPSALEDGLISIEGKRFKRDFVGDQRSGTLPDRDHDGVSGERIDEIMERVDCTVPAYRPNVVTLHAGTNDMNQNRDLATAPDRLGALIDQVLHDAPEAVVIVATLIPSTKDGLQPRIDAYNARIPGLVKQRQEQGKHVLVADMSMVTTDDVDGSHPNDTGYRKMADVFYNEIWRASDLGWIEKPVPGSGKECPEEEGSKAGPGWRALGVIAPGMEYPEGRTDIVELNGDNRGDYVRLSGNGGLRVALNTAGEPGKPDWVELGVNYPRRPWGPASVMRFADLNGDGRDDMVRFPGFSDKFVDFVENLGVKDGRIQWGDIGLIFAPIAGIPLEAVRFADIDGDGRDDLLRVGENGAVHAYVNQPGDRIETPRWVERLDWAPGVRYGSRDKLRLADVNGDRRADYLMVGGSGAVHAYINNGGRDSGGFTEQLNFVNETGYPGDKAVFRDISGDGRADYLVVYDGGSVRAWLNRGGNTGP